MQNIQYRTLVCFMLLTCWGVLQTTYAQTDRSNRPQYAASKIAENLLDGANAVIRTENNHFTVHNKALGTLTVTQAITILNESGKRYADYTVGYDKLIKINYMRARVYDKNGKYIRTLKKREIKDYSQADGYSLYSDNRIKYASMSHNEYPYTVLFEYQQTFKGLFYYPGWFPQISRRISVEKSEFTINTPSNLPFRYKALNLEKASKPTGNSGKQTWKIANLETFKTERYSKQSAYPRLILAPTTFSIEGYEGNMQSWKSYGDWVSKLNDKRDVISNTTIQKLKSLTANAKSDEEKIQKIYEHLQQNTRYVSIQLGIGGWQTFRASVVEEKGYGDCKALSNYTYAMLKALGIKSHYTLVRSGRNERAIQTDFPASQFNHVILCVPNKQDTIWLECTSQRESFGYLGSFTGDRDVLLITPNGGKVVHTPVYDQSVNTLYRSAQVTIDAEGNAQANVKTNYQAVQSEEAAYYMNQKPDRQKKWLYKQIDLPSFEIRKFNFALNKGKLPVVTEQLTLKVRKLASKSGKRLFLKPNILNRLPSQYIPARNKKRKNDIFIPASRAFTDVDTINYQIPEKYHAEYKPQPIKIESEFGTYDMQVKMDAGKITYIRKLVVKAGSFPKEKYNDMIKFYKKVVKADKEMVVLVSGT